MFFSIQKYFQETIRYLLNSTPIKKSKFCQIKTLAFGGIISAILILQPTIAQHRGIDSMVLNASQIEAKMQTLPGWTTNGEKITRTFQFANFVESVDFVNKLVEPAETAGHHPDIAISYNKVTISLTTHDAGGLTDKDFSLAKIISALPE